MGKGSEDVHHLPMRSLFLLVCMLKDTILYGLEGVYDHTSQREVEYWHVEFVLHGLQRDNGKHANGHRDLRRLHSIRATLYNEKERNIQIANIKTPINMQFIT